LNSDNNVTEHVFRDMPMNCHQTAAVKLDTYENQQQSCQNYSAHNRSLRLQL
jgi:hypothetical protein